MAQYLPLPDGTSVTIREGETPAQAWARAQQMYPEAFAVQGAADTSGAQSGFTPALKAGFSELKSGLAALAGRAGVMDQAAAEKYLAEEEAYRQRTYKPTATFGEAPLTKTAELFGGSIPYMLAPLGAGAAVAAAPLTGTAATIAGLGAAGAASATQFTGSNLMRQLEEGKKLGETDIGSAALAAIPQAALDTLSLKMMPGIRNLFAEAGKELTAPVAKRIAEQGLKEVAKDYALATGKTMGMEGLTESGQQVFERLQAGLSLTDEKARDEYLENFLGGAVMGGVLAPGGRFVERRGEAKKQEQERLDKAMAERAKEEEARAKEAAFRATPEGALQFVEDYETRQARLNEIKDIKKPGKDATPLEQAEFDDIKKEREGLRKQLYKDSTEYKEAKAKADTLLEQRRVEKLSPEEFMMEQLGVTTPTAAAPQAPAAPPKMRTVVDEFGQVTEVPEGVEETEAATPAQTYMEGQVRAAQEAGRLGLDEYADYIMQDPKMAAEVVKTRTKMPGLSGTENNTLLSGVSLRLRDIEKQRAAETRAVMEQRAADLRAQQPTPEIENQLAEIEQRLAETAEKGPSYVEPTFEYLNPLFEQALGGASVIQVSETVQPTTKAAATRARVEALMREADQADKDYQLARRVERKPDAAIAAKQRGKNAIDQIAALSKEGNDYAREFLATRNQQMESLAKLTDIAEQLRTGQVLGKETYVDEQGRVQPVEPGKGVAAATEQSLRDKADKVRANLITSVLQEAATHRRAAGQQPITQDEALIAASKLDDTVKAWMDRAMAKPAQPEFEDVIVEPAQMRGDKLVRPAKTERRMVTAPVKGLSPAEMAHFQSRIEAIRSQLSAPAPGPKQRVEADLLRRQYATEEQKKVAEARGETAETLGGELRRRAEYVRNKMGRMQLTPQNVGKAWLGTRNALNKAADALDSGKATRELLDAVEPVVDAVLKKVEIKPVDLRAIDDALKAMAPTAQEQKEAGQKQLGLLFQAPGERARLAETDLGYVRMTPQAFANSPKIKAVWAALDKARAALKRKAAKQATAKQRNQAAAQTLTRLKGAIDNIKADTKFFWADTSKWTDTQLAKAYAGYPEIGNNPEEQALVDKYLKGTDEDRKLFTQEEKEKLDLLFRRFRDTKMPQYQQRMQEAMTLLAQGQRLDDLDNQLLQVMQDANASTVKAVTAQRKELAVLREAIKQIKTLSKNEKVSPLAKRVEALQKQADKARSKYNERVELLYKDAYKRMDDALAEILDPEIKRTNEEIAKAKNTLEAEKANLDKIKKNFENILAQKEGANRTELATYELFRYEEKLDVIKDLEKKIEEYEASLAEDMETRFEAHDQAAAVLEAVMDKKVQAYRDRVVALEEQIATLRGEGVLAVEPGGRMELPSLRYPMAAQKYEADLKAAEAALKNVKRQQVETQERAKSQAQQMDEFWKEQLGGMGIKREKGRVEPIVSEKEKQLEKLRREEREKADRAYEAERKEQIKTAQVESIDNEVAGLVEELGAYEEFPNELAALKKLIDAEDTPPLERAAATAKAGIIQNIESLEAQREVLLEGKPAKKRGPATAPSTAAMGAQKPLRTGFAGTLEETNKEAIEEANELAKKVLGTKAPKLTVSTARQARMLDPNMGLFDDYEFSRGKPENGSTKKSLEAEINEHMGEELFNRPDEALVSDKLEVYESPEAFIKQNPEYAKKIPTDAKGFAHKGKVVLFASNIEKGHALGVLLHEIGVHVGFRNFFNEGQYKALVKLVESWTKKTDDSIEARVGRAAKARVEAAGTKEDHVGDELLAYAVEEALRMGVEPVGVKKGSPIQNFIRMVFDAFKNVLAKFGVDAKSLTAGDLVNLAYGAAQLELKGTWHGTGVEFDMFDHEYMSSGEGAQVFGWGTYRGQKYGTAKHYYLQELSKKLDAWRNSDAMINWANENAPEVNGIKIVEGAITVKQLAQELGISREEATVLRGGMETLIKDLGRDRRFSLSPATLVDIDLEVLAGEVKDSPFEYPAGHEQVIERVRDKIKTGKLRIVAVSDKPYYKDVQASDIDDMLPVGAERKAAKEVLRKLDYGNYSGTFAERVKQAVDDVKYNEEMNVKYSSSALDKMRAQRTLEGLKTLKVSDFTFRQETPPPVPKPIGYMLRTIHTQPEEHYLRYELPLNKQSKYVQDAVKSLVNNMTEEAQLYFVNSRYYSEGAVVDRDGATLYRDLADTLHHAGIPQELSEMFASEALRAEGVAGIKYLEGVSRAEGEGYFNYVDFNDRDEGTLIVAKNIEPVRYKGSAKERAKDKEIFLSRAASFNNPEMEALGTSKIVAQQRSWTDKIKANTTGLAFETQLIDRFAGFERLRKYMDPHKGAQMLYYMRMYDQRMNFVSQAVSNGAPQLVEKTRPDGGKEFVIEAKDGASIANVVKILSGAQKHVGNAEAVNQLFTTYLAALRADRVGLDALNFGGTITQDMLDKAKASVNGNADLKAVFEKARGEYNSYNRNMIDFVASTGALSEEVAKRLAATNDYIPFYRERNGVAEMIIGGEAPIRVGSIAEQPYLHELVGGDQPILDFMTSSVQNTNMLVDMGLRNMATKNAVFELVNLNAAKIVKAAEGPDVVKFKVDGKDRYAVISSEKVTIGSQTFDTGVPADLLVKGMEGIPTQMPMLLRAMSAPAQLLRKAVTLSPLYMAKQLFRDSLAAPIISGADFTPIMGALKQIGSPTKGVLERRGITGGQVFHGTSADLTKILRDIADGKPGWQVALGKLEAAGMEADALTRRAQYNSYIKQGMSEMEATLLALESMNFNKRGASPSIHLANSLYPFFNAQIQGLNVLYRAMFGQITAAEKARIKSKLITRGAMLAAATLAYAHAMQDDEAYKNALPSEKYNNWFLRIPGVAEPVRIPIPFEVGYIFKALPEAIYNTIVNERGAEEAKEALLGILRNVIPGGSSYFIPQAMKPALEVLTNYSMFTERPMMSAKEQALLPEYQYRDSTTQLAKLFGGALGVSPIKIDALVNGYFSTMGMAAMQLASLPIPAGDTPEKATRRMSELPVVGSAFQPNDARWIINSTYDALEDARKTQASYKELVNRGEKAEARTLLDRRASDFAQAQLAGYYRQQMGLITQYEGAVRASDKTPDEKRALLDKARQMKIKLSNLARQASDAAKLRQEV